MSAGRVWSREEEREAELGATFPAQATLFTLERMVEETAAAYERLVGKSRGADTASHAARG